MLSEGSSEPNRCAEPPPHVGWTEAGYRPSRFSLTGSAILEILQQIKGKVMSCSMSQDFNWEIQKFQEQLANGSDFRILWTDH